MRDKFISKPSIEAKNIAFGITDIARELQDSQDTQKLDDLTLNRCTAFQKSITDLMNEIGIPAGIVTDPDAKVDNLNQSGHTIGFIKVSPETNELIAFDATIAQHGEENKKRRTKIWFGNAEQLSAQLHNEFGGSWLPEQIQGCLVFND